MNDALSYGTKDADLDKVGTFTPQTFLVQRRLRSLAHRLANVAPTWIQETQAQHSVSVSTSKRLEDEGLSLSTATHPHQQVRSQIIVKSLMINIDINIKTRHSLLNLEIQMEAIENRFEDSFSSELGECTKYLVSERIDKPPTRRDDSTEGPIQVLLHGIFINILALVSFTFLQLWQNQDSWKKPVEKVLNLSVSPQQTGTDSFTNNPFKPDFKFQGGDFQALCYADAKNFSSAQRKYPTHNNMSKDTYIQQLMRGGKGLAETFMKVPSNGWQAHTHHLLAQVLFLFLI